MRRITRRKDPPSKTHPLLRARCDQRVQRRALGRYVRGCSPGMRWGQSGVSERERMAQMEAAVIFGNGRTGGASLRDVPDPEPQTVAVVVDAEAISTRAVRLLARAAGDLLTNPTYRRYLSAGIIARSPPVRGTHGRRRGGALNAAAVAAARRLPRGDDLADPRRAGH